MRSSMLTWRLSPVVTVAAVLLILILTGTLLLSVQAASIYVVEPDANVSSYELTLISGVPNMVYYDSITKSVKLMVCSNVACETGTSTISTLLAIDNPVTVVMTSIGGFPFIVYSDPTAKQLKAISCLDLTCSTPTINLVANLLSNRSQVKSVTSINGKPLIVYLDVQSTGTYQNTGLNAAACPNTACDLPITITTLHTDDEFDWGKEFHAAYSGGYPIISFLHEDQLKLGVCSNVLCNGYTSWRILDGDTSALDSSSFSSHGLTLVNGKPLLVYQTRFAGGAGETRTAACADATCLIQPTVTAHDFSADDAVAATSYNDQVTIVHRGDAGASLYLSTCGDAVCSGFSTRLLPLADYNKRAPQIVSIGLYPAVAYLHTQSTLSLLNYYFDGDYTPVQPSTPSPVPTATFTMMPTLPPTLPATLRPMASVTPMTPLPTLSAPSTTIMIDGATNLQRVTMKLDQQGLPVIAYRVGNQVKLARCTHATTCAPQIFTIATLTYAINTMQLVVNSSGLPFVSYDTGTQLYLDACDSPTSCDTTNRHWLIDSGSYMSEHALALDSGGVPVLAYKPANSRYITIARCESATSCAAPSRFTLFDPRLSYLQGLALALDSAQRPILAYSDGIYKTLRLAQCDSATSCSTPSITTIGTGNGWVDLVLDGGVPLISSMLHDYAYHGTLIYLVRCESAATCNTPTQTIVDAAPYVNTGDNNKFFMALDTARRPVLTHIEGPAFNVRLDYCDSPLCAWPDRMQLDGGSDFKCRRPTVAIDGQNRVYVAYTKTFNNENAERLMLYMGSPFDLPPAWSSNAAPYRNYFTMHQPLLTWGAVNWAAGYEIQVDDAPDFTSLIRRDNTLRAPVYQAAFANGTYYWRVRAKNAQGKWGGWSTVETFVIAAP